MDSDFNQNPNDSQITEMCILAVSLFGTDNDPAQADPNLENSKKLIALDSGAYIYDIGEGGTIKGWSCVLPTSKQNMELFLKGKINERQLFEYSIQKPAHEALYLIAAIVMPEHRNKGLGSKMMEWQIKYFQKKYGIQDLYAFTISEEGKGLVKKIEKDLSVAIRTISKI